ncbi:MAG TPA: cyclase family protein [Thermoleophilaceae bacterium]
MTNAEFRALYAQVSTWDHFGETSERGALNYLTPESVVSAAELVLTGVTVTLSRPVDDERRVDNPTPADHHMTMLTDVDIGSGSLRFAKDYVGLDYHNEGHSHVDAFCHVAFDGCLYGGARAEHVTNRGADIGAIDLLEDGLVGRGVLLDIPRSRGVDWIEPGEYVFREDLEAAERDQRVEVRPGDILLVRTGHARRLAELGPWDTQATKSGLHPDTAPFVKERCVAALGSDGNNDAAPGAVAGVSFPMHVLALNAMGVHLLDYLQFEDLAPYCEDELRWEFLFVAAPLRIDRGTGSPLNPIAIF